MKATTISLLLCGILAACTEADSVDRSNSGEIECKTYETCKQAVAELQAAEKTMNREFDGAIARLRACTSNSTKCYNMPRAIELVSREQESWLAWRDAHCDVLAFGMEETSAHGELQAACRADLTAKRTTELMKVMPS